MDVLQKQHVQNGSAPPAPACVSPLRGANRGTNHIYKYRLYRIPIAHFAKRGPNSLAFMP